MRLKSTHLGVRTWEHKGCWKKNRPISHTGFPEKIGIPEEEEEPAAEPSQTMSREDIMAEVQSLVNGKPLKQ